MASCLKDSFAAAGSRASLTISKTLTGPSALLLKEANEAYQQASQLVFAPQACSKTPCYLLRTSPVLNPFPRCPVFFEITFPLDLVGQLFG